MNRKGNYSAIVAIMAVSLVFFVAVSSQAPLSSDKAALHMQKFRQLPLLTQNARILYDNLATAAIMDFYSNPRELNDRPEPQHLLSWLDNASEALGSSYGLSCTTGIATGSYSAGGGVAYELSFEAELSCNSEEPFPLQFSRRFSIRKGITTLPEEFAGYNLVEIIDLHSGEPEFP
jgi:hypothetical protein